MQAIALQILLARAGIQTELRLGVTSTPSFAAHAWLEQDGRVLIGGDPAGYVSLE